MNTPGKASLPVIKRLPKYYRYLRTLKNDGITSISSRELAAQMGTTASQVRQDFNCIGDVNGRQGIGYSVENLLNILEDLLFGNGDRLSTILIGCGRLGKAVSRFITPTPTAISSSPPSTTPPTRLARRSTASRSSTSMSWRRSAPSITPRWPSSVCPAAAQRRSVAVWWRWGSRASGTSPTTTCRCPTPMSSWRTSISATA